MRWIALGCALCGLLWAACDSKPPAKDGDTAKTTPVTTTTTPPTPAAGSAAAGSSAAPTGAMLDGEVKVTGMT